MRSKSIIAAFVLTGCVPAVGDPPNSVAADSFYQKHVDASGIPVLSSSRTPDQALTTARDIIADMLDHRPDLREALVRADYRVSIIAEDEALLDLPENAHWTRPAPDDPRLTRCERKHYETRIGQLTDRAYWDARARGIGGLRTAGSEEDILGYRSSRYYGETIFVHEFAHNVLFAIEDADPDLYIRVQAAYENAVANRLWFNEYAITNVQEYWAEGTQFWFNSNRLVVVDGRQILSHEDLRNYDPTLFAVLAEAYGLDHHLTGDPFHNHPARIPDGPIPDNTAEIC